MKLSQLVLALLAAFGLLCAVMLFTRQIPEALRPSRDDGRDVECPPCAQCDCDPGAGGAAATAVAPGVDTTDPLQLARHRVCERIESLPTLQRVGEGRWLIHCGPEAHLIAIESRHGQPEPRRIARFVHDDAGQAGLPHPGHAITATLDAGGAPQLLLGTVRMDASSTPVGGEVHRIPLTTSGGLGAPERLLALTPGALHAAELDGSAPPELVVLHRGSARLQQPAELWVVAGGPSPVRRERRPTAPSAVALVAVDLDGDGKDELAAAAPADGRVEIWLSLTAGDRGDAPAAPAYVQLKDARELLATDMDGDGKAELLALGESLVRIAIEEGKPRAEPITTLAGLRGLHAEDLDADGRPELIAYAHPALMALAPGSDPRELLRFEGDGASIISARFAQLDGDGHPDVIALMLGDGPDGAVELAIAQGRGAARRAAIARTPVPLADAPLSLRLTLP